MAVNVIECNKNWRKNHLNINFIMKVNEQSVSSVVGELVKKNENVEPIRSSFCLQMRTITILG